MDSEDERDRHEEDDEEVDELPEDSEETGEAETDESEPEDFSPDDVSEEDLVVEDPTVTVELADAPVRLYLKEIGRVELLGPDQELWLATRMAAERRLELLRAGRAPQLKPTVEAAGVHLALFEDLQTTWTRLSEDIKKRRVHPPDLHLILEEARQLRVSWQ